MCAASETVGELQAMEVDTSWPEFPVVLREAVGARAGAKLFAGLGSAGASWYALDADTPAAIWQQCADFPGAVPSGAACAATDAHVFVFGGVISAPDSACLQQSDAIWRYDIARDHWEQLSLLCPVGFLGASACRINTTRLWIVGGYNRSQLDAFFRQQQMLDDAGRKALLHQYMDRPVEDFGWNPQIWELDTQALTLKAVAAFPQTARCGAGLIHASEHLWYVSGESKPGLRDPLISSFSIRDGVPEMQAAACLPAAQEGMLQEGVAAAFAGAYGGMPVVAGGPNFPGAAECYRAGQHYAHAGLRKSWRREIYIYRNQQWHKIGNLPAGRAHGLMFELAQGLLLVGGDTQDGAPVRSSWLLSFQWND